jgi:branched-chain amino acid transport system ATP-binding protein
MAELLRIENLSAGYADAVVLNEIGLTLDEGKVLAVLGRNGMGKTTLIATLMGATQIHGGRISFRGVDITRLPSHRRAEIGLGWVPQERDIFPSLTVEENLSAVARPGPWSVSRVFELFPRLAERRRNLGNQLSGGEQQMLAIGRALAINPALLLLDEPLEGLAPIIVQELLAAIRAMIRGQGLAAILVEQHARQILPLADRALVLERGRVVHDGPSAALAAEPRLLERWLGAVGKSAAR